MNIHEGTFRKLCHIVRHVYNYVDISFEKIKYSGDIRRNYKFRRLILCPECVTRNDILKPGFEELHFTEEWLEMKVVITAVRNRHIVVYWYIGGNTDLHNSDVIVPTVIIFTYDYTCSTMNSSTSNGVSGARHHRDRVRIVPVDSKILLFMLCIQLMEYYIINSIGSLAMNSLYVYIRSVINELWNFL